MKTFCSCMEKNVSTSSPQTCLNKLLAGNIDSKSQFCKTSEEFLNHSSALENVCVSVRFIYCKNYNEYK